MDIMPPDNQLPPHHAPTGLKLWLAIFAIVLVVALAYLVWASNTAPDTTDNSATTVKKTATATTDETADWKTYADTKTGFSFKVPATLKIEDSVAFNPANVTSVFVKTYNLATMEDDPRGYDKEILTMLRDDLKSGKVKSYISGLYAKETLTTTLFEVCSVMFLHTLNVFDGNDTMVHLEYSLESSDRTAAIKNNPSHFTKDAANCGNESIWKENSNFESDLAAGITDSLTQQWYKDFALIAKSFKFTN